MSIPGNTTADSLAWGSGPMAAAVRAFDWAATPLGPIAGWPESLRVAVGICLNSRFPMFVWWGPGLINIYNDAYAPILGRRHPRALGRPARDTWDDIWSVVGPQADAVMTRGESTWNDRVLLVMERNGYAENTWFTWSYSPIPNGSGGIGGLFCACTEETPRVLAEERVTSVLESVSDAFFAVDASWRFTYLNQHAERLLRHAPGELLGQVMWEAFPALAGTEFERAYRGAAADRVTRSVTAFYPDHDRWYEVHAYPANPGISVYFRDVTERKRAEAALYESEARFRAAFDQSVVGIVLTDLDGRVVRANEAFCRLVGRPFDALDGRTSDVYTHADDVPQNVDILGRLKADAGASRVFVKRYVRPDGSVVYAQPTVTSVFDADGRPVGLVAVVQDVTEQHRAEAAIARLSEQRRLALDAAEMGSWSYDVETEWVAWDDRYAEIFGVAARGSSYDEALARIHPDDRPAVRAAAAAAADPASPVPFAAEYRVLRPDGAERWVEAHGLAAFAGAPGERRATGLVGTVADVTERKRDAIRNRFLLALDDAVRPLADPARIVAACARLLGEHLRADRSAYAEVLDDQDTFDLTGDYNRGVPSIVGRYRFADFGAEVLRLMRADEPYVVADVEGHSPPIDDPTAYRLTMIRAVVCVPLHKAGRLVAAMAVHQATPRSWRADEVALVRHVAARCWESIERARVGRALYESDERLRLVVTGAKVGIWYCPLPFDRLIWDATVKEHFHLPPDAEVTIDTFYERIHPDDRDATREAIGRSIARREPYDIDYRTVSPDGRDVKWIRATGRGFYDPSGAPQRFDGITIDVTERTRAQVSLRESEARFRNMSDYAPVMIWVTRPDGYCEYLNKLWYDFTGQGEAEALGFGWLDAVHPDDAGRTGQAFLDANANGGPFNVEYRLRRADGAYRWCIDAARPRFGPGGEFLGYIGTVTDITDRAVAEQERASLLDRERAARVEAERQGRMKDEFLATLSHELRTPLNAILGWSQVLRGERSAEDLDEGLSTIERNARAQTQIIDDLMDMSRVISGKMRLDVQRVDLAGIVRDGIETVRPAADAKGIRLQPAIDPHAGGVSGDASRLGQVLWNLLSNAIKFTPRGGRVQVVLGRVDSHVELAITDTGEGIAPAFLPHVFDRFRQADGSSTRRHGGLGLGLSIVKELVELHGGTVSVRSAGPGCGSTFTVKLPLVAIHPEPEPAPQRRHPTAPAVPAEPCAGGRVSLTGVNVLVVDDEPDARALVRRLLEDCGATVRVAASAAEAFDVVRAGSPDVLVSDIGMPGEDGYTLIRRVRELGRGAGGDVPALALTAYARAEDRMRAVRAGYQMHVAKPVEPAELTTMVASLAGRAGD